MAVPRHKETWSAQDGRAVAAMFTEDGVRVEAAFPGARLNGREAIAKQCQMYMDAAPGFLEHRTVSESADGHTVTISAHVGGNGYTGPSHFAFTVSEDRIALMRIMG